MTLLAAAAISGSALPATAAGLTPGAPTLSMTFDISGDQGVINGTVTAPTSDAFWTALPDGTEIRLEVVRSCYAAGETNLPVFSKDAVSPGESVSFTDNQPWTYGNDYTYNAYAYIGENQSTYPGYGSCSPGLDFGVTEFSASQQAENGDIKVTLTAKAPAALNGYPPSPLPCELQSLVFYRATNTSYPFTYVEVGRVENPAKGSVYSVVDDDPQLNTTVYYKVEAVTPFGIGMGNTSIYVGWDVPANPYPAVAEVVADGVKISWTAPSEGKNGGMFDPAQTRYSLWRVWGQGDDHRLRVATDLTATEYIDHAADLTAPMACYYEVVAFNEVGTGGSAQTSYDFDILIGPDYKLPFVETFDAGTDKLWSYESDSYYLRFYTGEEAEYGESIVTPYSGDGLMYVEFADKWNVTAESSAHMTSYRIDASAASTPVARMHYYAIPGCDGTVAIEISTDGSTFSEIARTEIGHDATQAGWRELAAPFTPGVVYLRIKATAGENPSTAIFDDIIVTDYAPVGQINVTYDTENCTATLTWADPSSQYAQVTGYEGFVNNTSVGSVSSPWVYQAEDYKTPYVVSVRAFYGQIPAQQSPVVTVYVPKPEYVEFEAGDYTFVRIPDTASDVEIKKYNGHGGIVNLPEMVNYDDIDWTVKRVADNAFAGNEALVSITFKNNIVSIGEEAFSNCTGLIAASFGTSLSEIGARAFDGCRSLNRVIFLSPEPPAVGENAFRGVDPDITGSCPEGSEDAYQNTPNLENINFGGAGINDIAADGAVMEYYSTDGSRLAEPARNGVTIIRIINADGSVKINKICKNK